MPTSRPAPALARVPTRVGAAAGARLAVVGIVLAILTACSSTAHAAAPWTIMGGAQQVASADVPTGVEMTVTGGTTPTNVWLESGSVYAARWNGSAWTALGKVNGAGAATEPDISNDGSDPWVSYTEVVSGTPRVFVKEYVAGTWTARGGALNINTSTAASDTHIINNGSTVYVTWTENGLLRGKVWNGSSWTAFINTTTGMRVAGGPVHGDVTFAGGVLFAITQENVGGSNDQVRVYRYSGAGTAWTQLGTGQLNTVTSIAVSGGISIASDGTKVWAGWHEWTGSFDQVRVAEWSGSAWSNLGGFINRNGNNATVAVNAGTVYVAHNEVARSTTASVLERWDGSSWKQVGGIGYAVDGDNDTGNTDIGFIGSDPVISFLEIVGGTSRVYTRRLTGTNVVARDITNVTVTASPGQAVLDWTNPGGGAHAGVRIYRSTTQGVLGTLVTTTGAGATTWTDTGRTNGVPLFYTLVALNSTGDARETAYDTMESFQSSTRTSSAVASDGSVAWTFGGFGASLLGDIWRYDPATDLLADTTPWALPSGRQGAAAAYATNVGRAYVFGGRLGATTSTDIVRFDPVTGVTSVVASLPSGRAFATASYVAATGRIYLFGGEDFAGTTTYNTIYEFNPTTETLTTLGVTLPIAVSRAASVGWTPTGCAYVIGGITGAGVRQAGINRFCPSRGAFPAVVNPVASLPAAASQVAAYATANEIVVAGGTTGTLSKAVASFVPSTGTVLTHELVLPNRTIASSAEVAVGVEARGMLLAQSPSTQKATQVNAAPIRTVTPSNPPATPTNATPIVDGYLSPTLPTLTASAFSDPDGGAVHGASQWQVRSDAGTYASPVYDSGADATQLTSAQLRGATAPEGIYWYRVRYADAGAAWSGWSTETRAYLDATAPTASSTTPSAGATTSATPTLTASYADTGSAPSGTVAFQLCSDPACSTVVQSGSDGPIAPAGSASWNPTSLTNGTYHWRVRPTDSAGNVGVWTATRSIVVAQVTVGALTPASIPRGRQARTIQIAGTNFASGAVVAISGANVTIASTTFMSATRIDIVIDVASAATNGARNVTVTNPGGNAGTATGGLTIVDPSITITLSTVGFADGARQTVPSHTIAFGSLLPNATREIGSAASGQTRTGEAAIEATVSSDVDYVTTGSVAAWSGPATLGETALQFRAHGATPWLATSIAPFSMRGVQVPEAPASSRWDYDLRLDVPAMQTAGSYSTTMTIVIAPAV